MLRQNLLPPSAIFNSHLRTHTRAFEILLNCEGGLGLQIRGLGPARVSPLTYYAQKIEKGPMQWAWDIFWRGGEGMAKIRGGGGVGEGLLSG